MRYQEICHVDITRTALERKRKRIDPLWEYLTIESNLRRGKPKVSKLFRNIENELIKQIENYSSWIRQERIEEWLLNFEDDRERLTALNLLDRLGYVPYAQLKSISTKLYDRIMMKLKDIQIEDCIFCNIGDLTSSSTQIVGLFQQENGINKNLFFDHKELDNIKDKRVLLLLDDFVGSGNTFVEWFSSSGGSNLLEKFEKVYHCVLTAFDKGLTEIMRQTTIETIYGFKYDRKEMVLEGEQFNDVQKREIEKLVLKYKDHFPRKALWGYDNCQLLVAFETNIPNNTLPIFWSEKNWNPLIKRK